MIKLTQERNKQEWSRAELGRRAHLHPSQISQIELRRLVPYPKQMKRLAVVLKFEGDPQELLDEVEV
jgi:ribosome-binding protein aMBF1 (putative translation factor)